MNDIVCVCKCSHPTRNAVECCGYCTCSPVKSVCVAWENGWAAKKGNGELLLDEVGILRGHGVSSPKANYEANCSGA